MRSRKVVSVLLMLALVLTVFAGCSKKDAATSPSPSATPKESVKPAWQTEKITLKFFTWEDKDVVDPLIKAFMEKYPNITVEKVNPTGNQTDFLVKIAASGDLPDVMSLESVVVPVQNDWLYDMNKLWNADPETKTVYPNMAANGVFNGKRLAAPSRQSIMGVFVNKTMFEKANIPLPSYNWTMDQMLDLAGKLTNVKDSYFGLGGAWGNLSFEEMWPMINNANLGMSGYDGTKFNFGQDWIDGYNKKLELRRTKVEEHMNETEKQTVFGDKGAWPTAKGHVAMAIDGSWNLSGWLEGELKKVGATMDFYPYPAGKAGQNMPVILDYVGISSKTKYPEAAYELSKFMTWGKEGWAKRIQIVKAANKTFGGYPVSENTEAWAKIQEATPLPGLKAAIALMPKAVPDLNKVLPGLREYSAWKGEQKFDEKFESGELKPADKAKEMEAKFNEFVAAAKAKLPK